MYFSKKLLYNHANKVRILNLDTSFFYDYRSEIVIGRERLDMTIDTNNGCSITAPFPVLLAHIIQVNRNTCFLHGNIFRCYMYCVDK